MFSRYEKGGKTDYVGNQTTWWERKTFTKTQDDLKITIDKKYHKRPDRLAFDLYGTAAFNWFVLQYNNILDTDKEFVEGKQITLPTANRFKSGVI